MTTGTTSPTDTAPARTGRRPRGRYGAPAALIAPFLVLFTACTLVPIGYAVWLSLFTEHRSGLGFGGSTTVFDGIGNYTHVLADHAFRSGFVTIGCYVVLYIPVMVALSLALSLLLDSALVRARRFVQLSLFLPHAVPGVIAALIWAFLYTPGVSPVVAALGGGLNILGHPLPAVVNVAVWEWTGYNVVIFYAALQAVPREVLEAAVVDGAGPLRTALSIKVPLIRSSLAVVALFTVIGSLQLFTEPTILQGAAPGITSSWTPNMFAWTAAFTNDDYGVAAASSVILAVAAAALSFVVTRATRNRPARRTETAA